MVFVMGILTAISITTAVVLGLTSIGASKGVKETEYKVDQQELRLLTLEKSYEVLGEKIDRLIKVVENHTGTR